MEYAKKERFRRLKHYVFTKKNFNMENLSVHEFKQLSRKKPAWLQEQSVDLKLELLCNHLSLCQIMNNELLEEEVIERAGVRYSREKPEDGRYSRWSYNPGSALIGDKKLKVDVPRVMDKTDKNCVPLERYNQLRRIDSPSEQLVQGVVRGLSTRDYGQVIDYLEEGFGLSKSQVSRAFVERTKEKMEAFRNRSLSHYEFVTIFLDGKYLSGEQIIIAMGVTLSGDKIPLDFLHASSESSGPVKDLFRRLKERGMNDEKGLLFVADGSKGFRKAIAESFAGKALVQRCKWHKRENILKYLPDKEHAATKEAYHRALEQSSYEDARADLLSLASGLEPINISAARSLKEGMEELLTLHKLKMYGLFGQSFSTTNCIENLNSQLKKYVGKVRHRTSSGQRHRGIASALLEIESNMHKVKNYRKLDQLQNAIILALNTESSQRISTKNGT